MARKKRLERYKILISEKTMENIIKYKMDLIYGRKHPGKFLAQSLLYLNKPVQNLNLDEFIDVILSTKKSTLFADAVKGGGKDWNDTEISILGDINVAIPVKIYDNGVWDPNNPDFIIHTKPLTGELLYTCGLLLKSGREFAGIIPDLLEVTQGKTTINQNAYNAAVERRLLPLFLYANANAGMEGKPALITIPGLGAGVFAGAYVGTIGERLNIAIKSILEKYYMSLQNIGLIYYDPFDECRNEQIYYGNLEYRVRPQMKGNNGKTQLSNPFIYEELGDDFSDYKLYKIVAWNHFALPGNGYFRGRRWTDDAVAAAATDSMKGLLGVSGRYDKRSGMYLPPRGYANWSEVVKELEFHLTTIDKLLVTTNSGELYKFTG